MKRSLGWLAGIYVVYCSRAIAQTPARTHSLIELRAVRDRPAARYSVRQSVDDTTFYLAERPLVSDNDIAEASADTTGLKLAALRSKEALCSLRFSTSVAA
jgi:hypothetical protein